MGWNSWDCYGPAVNEEQLLGNAAYMAEHLKDFGWQYVVCDIQWSEPHAGETGWDYVPLPRCVWMNTDGKSRQKTASPLRQAARAFGLLPTKSTKWG